MKMIILSAIGLALVSGIAIGQHTPRFEAIYTQYLEDRYGYGYISNFSVFHDKDTGQEIVCIERSTYDSNSCYLTGRKWGGN